MTMHVKNAGAWVAATPYAKVSGIWKPVVEGWVKVSGAWTKFYNSVVFALSSITITDSTAATSAASVTYSLLASGVEQYNLHVGGAVALGNWIVPNTNAANYEVYFSPTSGSVSTGTINTWLQLNTNRSWTCAIGSGSYKVVTANVTIREIATGTNVAFGTVTLEADATP